MRHYYEKIHGWSNFLPWYKEAVQKAPEGAQFVEIGAYRGRSAAYLGVEILNAKKGQKLHVVDPWVGTYERVYKAAQKNLAPLVEKGAVEIHRDTSASAAAKFKGKEFYMVNIDGDHSYWACSYDIRLWWPKIAAGGFLMGDDYREDRFPGVHRAVNEWADQNRLDVKTGFPSPQVEVPWNTWRVDKRKG